MYLKLPSRGEVSHLECSSLVNSVSQCWSSQVCTIVHTCEVSSAHFADVLNSSCNKWCETTLKFNIFILSSSWIINTVQIDGNVTRIGPRITVSMCWQQKTLFSLWNSTRSSARWSHVHKNMWTDTTALFFSELNRSGSEKEERTDGSGLLRVRAHGDAANCLALKTCCIVYLVQFQSKDEMN